MLFLAFDENDGLFDHVPPPAPPSYNLDGTTAGKATLDLRGEYFSDPGRKHLHEADQVSGTVRPWGLGPRVPMYVISPWSRGGWVNSQVFDLLRRSIFGEAFRHHGAGDQSLASRGVRRFSLGLRLCEPERGTPSRTPSGWQLCRHPRGDFTASEACAAADAGAALPGGRSTSLTRAAL